MTDQNVYPNVKTADEYQFHATCLITVVKFWTAITFFAINLQAMETYPTCLRQTGISIGMIFSNAFGILGPYIAYLVINVQAHHSTHDILTVLAFYTTITTFPFPFAFVHLSYIEFQLDSLVFHTIFTISRRRRPFRCKRSQSWIKTTLFHLLKPSLFQFGWFKATIYSAPSRKVQKAVMLWYISGWHRTGARKQRMGFDLLGDKVWESSNLIKANRAHHLFRKCPQGKVCVLVCRPDDCNYLPPFSVGGHPFHSSKHTISLSLSFAEILLESAASCSRPRKACEWIKHKRW